jgi:hypothetical protein
MNSPDSAAVPTPDSEALRKLGRMYRFARFRYSFLLLIPALWLLGFVLAPPDSSLGLPEVVLLVWFFVVLFGVAAWVFLVIPEKQEIQRKYVSHVLPFLFHQQGLAVNYYPTHDLSMAMFLRSGLFHEDYNTMLREDCLQGAASRMVFAMYQVAVQTISRVSGRYGASASSATNQFYGWAIHCIVPPVRNTHVILPRKRKTSDESDDWLEKTCESWSTNPKCEAGSIGYPPFDERFIVYTDNPQAFFSFATKEFLDFLIYLHTTTNNAFGINISGSLFALHMGHETPGFRHVPDGNFETHYNPELLQEVKWFADLIKGVQRFTAR